MDRLAPLFAFLKSLLSSIFGRISWQPPSWLGGAGPAARGAWQWLQPRRGVWLSLLAALVLGAGLWAGYPQLKKWFVGILPDMPEQHEVSVSLQTPPRTVVEEERGPNPLVLEFSRTAAPLAGIGKPAVDVTLRPSHPGRWVWTSDTRLEFQPAEDWPVGQEFEVELGKKALAGHILPDEREFKFTSTPFTATLQSAEFYQDPVQAGIRKAVFELAFSHPVQPAEFEKHLKLQYDDGIGSLLSFANDSLRFSVVYDKYRVHATVQSVPLEIPEQPRALVLHIDKGLSAQRGGPGTGKEIVHAVNVPGMYSLAIERVEDTIVTGEDGDPEHVLQVQSNMPVHEREMTRALSVWALPDRSRFKKGEETWEDPADITDEVLAQGRRIALAAVPQEREAGEAHAFRFNAEPGEQLFVRIAKGLSGVGGFRLGVGSDTLLKVKAYAPELSIMGTGALLALDGEKKLPLLIRDLPGVHVEIARVLPQQLHALVTQSEGNFTQPDFYGRLTPDDLSERFERDLPLRLKPGKTHYEPLDFSEYLHGAGGERRGIFLLSVQGWDPAKKAEGRENSPWKGNRYDYDEYYEGDYESERNALDPATMKDRRLLIITDLGFVLKRGTDGAEDVFVQSLGSGTPVSDAVVEVWGRNGLVLHTQRTDADGHARLPNLSGLKREKRAVMVAVRKGDDLAFMPLGRHDRSLDMSRFDVGGAYTGGLPNQTRAYLFSDRGIYRPGETIRIGALVKSADWAQPTQDLPLEAEIIDARGLVAKREPVTVGAAGMAEIAYSTFDSSPTGNYTINLNLARNRGAAAEGADLTPLTLGTVTVKVQEFQPDRMKIAARLSAESVDGWVSPRELSAKVNVQNLFGTPAPKRRVESTLTLRPAYPSFRKHPDYAFFDPQRAKQEFTQDLGSTETDDEGNVTLALGLDNYGQATYQLHLLVKAFEPEGGRNVAAEVGTLVSDLPYLVGFKADGSLGYVDRGATRIASLLAIDPSAKPIAVKGLTLQHIERRVVSVLVKQNSGLYKYESRAKEVVLKESPLTIPATGFKLTLDSGTPGNFAYVLRNADGLEMNRIAYSVAGTGNVSRSLDRNAELQLALNKKEYGAEEEIEINIRAPYTGAGLITIERDRVYAYKWFKTDKTSSVQTIRVPKGFEGNGYVSVQFVRDPASDEIYMSPLSYGVVPFATSLAEKTARVTLQAPTLIKPGQTLKLRLDSPAPVRALVFAVDEGILQVARYQNPDPLKFFFAKRALEVNTTQTLDLILPEFRKLMQAAAPGGDGDGALGKHLNPFKRRTDAPIAYWSGIVEVSGSREFTYTVPDRFNGALRIIAVAASDSTATAVTASTQVRGDLIILPTVPVSLTPGDEVEVGVGLANNVKGSGKDAPVTLKLQVSPHLEVVGAAAQTLKISERGEGATRFRIRARPGAQARLGSADVIFTAQYKQSSARLTNTVSVRPASPFVSLVQTGRLNRSGEIAAQGNFFPSLARSEVAVSATPWSFASGLVNYLIDYPHGCTEQITSQTFPGVILSQSPALATEMLATRRNGKDKAFDAKAALQRTLSVLRSRQGAEGGFGLWDGGYVEPFASAYATHMLLEARERKLPVPDDMYQRAFLYLQGYLANGHHNRYEWRNRSYAAYLLARQGTMVTAALVTLRANTPQAGKDEPAIDLGSAYLAAAYQLQKQDAQAAELLDPVWKDFLSRLREKRNSNFYGRYYDPLVHDSMLLFIVAKHFPARLKDLPDDTFERLGVMVQGGYYHSLSASSTILAIDAYSNQAAKSGKATLQIAALDRQGKATPLAFDAASVVSKALTPFDTARLRLSQQGELPLYYAWTEAGYARDVPTTAEAQGLEIVREFIDADGKPVSELSVGDDVTVRLRIRALNNRYLNDVAVADLLPGGLEPVLTAPGDSDDPSTPLWRRRLGGSGSWRLQYADIREDRVLFYGDVPTSNVEVTYKARATNPGSFVVPPAWGEAMYDRKIFARSAGGSLVVKPVAK